MRRLLCDLLGSSPEIEVVGTARDGREAVLQAVRLKPDVITLDVEMPEVSGLEALPLLLAAHEAPVVMVSALTQEGADVTLQALELGAVDFMPKPERNQLAEMRASRTCWSPRFWPPPRAGSGGFAAPTSPSTTVAHRRHDPARSQHPRLTATAQASRGGTTGQARGAIDDQPVGFALRSDLSCDRHLHRRPAGAQPDLPALDRAACRRSWSCSTCSPSSPASSPSGSIAPAP